MFPTTCTSKTYKKQDYARVVNRKLLSTTMLQIQIAT